MMISPFAIVLSALAVDAVFGDMAQLNQQVRHPVEWVGVTAERLEHWSNRGRPYRRRVAGAVIVTALTGASVFAALALIGAARHWFGAAGVFALELFFLGWLLASRTLYQHVAAVWRARDSLPQAQAVLALIVGRKTENLDENTISRAAIESLAENFSDGVMAPLFYYLLFGLPGVFAYKTINTLDSIYGYRDARYQNFGWAAARLDDIVNLIPARLSAALVFVTSMFYAPRKTLSAIVKTQCGVGSIARHWREQSSPNACWPEWAFASLLGIRLGGKRIYAGGVTQTRSVGVGCEYVTWHDIRRALRLYIAVHVTLVLLSGAAVILSSVTAQAV